MNLRASDSPPKGGVQAAHQAALDQGRFLVQHCTSCLKYVYFPRELCPHCGSSSLDFVEPGGLGHVHSVTTVRRKADAGGDLNVALIELDEGVRLMSRVEQIAPATVQIGQRVQARVLLSEGRGLVVFDPLEPIGPSPSSAPPPLPATPAQSTNHAASTAALSTLSSSSALSALPRLPALLSSPNPLRASAVIAGVATFGCGAAPGFTDMELLARSAHAAVADAGLTMADIDGLCTASAGAAMWPMPVIEYLGLRPRYIDGSMLGGSSFIAHLLPAMRALHAGQCKAVLVCYGSAQRSSALGRREIGEARRWLDPQPYEYPYQPMLPVSAYALAAARHMHQFGTTRRDLAEVAVAARAWAQLNPEAFMREPLTIDEVLRARMVSDPLSVRDCCLVTDGGGAYVLVRADRAKDLPQPPVYVLGNSTAVWNRQISAMDDLCVTAASESGRNAFAMAQLGAQDMGAAQLYDAFTINTLLFLEDLGFCKKGEAAAFVQNGGIAPGGHLPVNTNGGGLSCVHPGMNGIFALIEAVRQLRGDCGERQIPGIAAALAHGNGGTLSSQSTAILGTAAAL